MTGTLHDTGYKLLFSHPEMVRDLLTGYMPGRGCRKPTSPRWSESTPAT